MKPSKTEYDIGQTIYGQPLRLTFERSTDGRVGWTLHRDPANQRDDHQFIAGLSDEVILKMAEAVHDKRSGS